FAKQSMCEGKTIKLVLTRREDAKVFYEPVIQMTIIVELQGTHRVCYAFDRIRLSMRIIVHRVNTPLTTRTVMVQVENSIHDWISQTKVWRTHIDLRAQSPRTIYE